jgi:hypothetical protein
MDDRTIATVVQASLKFLPFEVSYAHNLDLITAKVQLYRASGGNPNSAQVVRDIHDFWLGHELLNGEQLTSDHVPFNFLSKERQVADLLARNIVTSLLPLWKEAPSEEAPKPPEETLAESESPSV